MQNVLKLKFYELGPLLRRGFWQPLHRVMQIFHVLPLTAALLTFFLLATNGQLREIYLSYLENLSNLSPGRIASTAANSASAVAVLALLSALLYIAHYELSTMRINIVYSSYSNPDAGSKVRTVQRVAAVSLALVPWLGLVAGLFGARNHLTETYNLLETAGIGGSPVAHLRAPLAWVIPFSVILQGLSSAFFLDLFRQNRFVQWTFIVIGPFSAAALFLLLTHSSPEMESGTPWSVLVGVIAIAAGFCVLHIYFYRMRTNLIYARVLRLDRDTGINLRRRRRIFLFFCALLPWLAIAFYFLIPLHFAGDVAPGPPSWVMVPLAMAWTIALGLSVAMLLDHFREDAALKWTIIAMIALLVVVALIASWRGAPAIVSVYRSVGPLGSIALELVFVFATLTLLAWLSQKSGFPALTLVALALVISTIFPVSIKITFVALTIVCVLLCVIALLSNLFAVAAVAALLILPAADNLLEDSSSFIPRPVSHAGPDSCQRFDAWLAQQGKALMTGAAVDHCGQLPIQKAPPDESTVTAQGQYPVFIIAVEGGGIYAAAAASLLLARLQDEVPEFSQHVFAISGVSGGAIGAAVFHALARSAFKNPAPVVATPAQSASRQQGADGSLSDSVASVNAALCPNSPAAHPSLCQEVSKIMQDDHLSPVVASIFPAFFGAPTKRDQTLAASFEDSVNSQDSGAAQELKDPFIDHWSEASQAPALVLNTTWVETGARVAFAPFPLHDSGNPSLYSFSDKYMPGEDSDISLMDAAVSSARFPGMLPSYSVRMDESTVNQEKHLLWNFVDGGYSDNSGASTALDLYRALEPIAQQRNVDIKVILLTSSNPEPKLDPADVQITGTAFHDTLAPIDAVMSVRSGLGNEAVARACDFFYPDGSSNNSCKGPASTPGKPLQIVEIDDRTFSLALGWKLSQTSLDVVSWMLGRPEQCVEKVDDAKPSSSGPVQSQQDNPPPASRSGLALLLEQFGLAPNKTPSADRSSGKMVLSNSCVLKHVEELLAGKQSDRR